MEPTPDLERALRQAWDDRAFSQLATVALDRYGPEILGVLAARLRSRSDAAEVFSMFTEDLWRGLPGFQWRCSLRAWAHRIARNASVRYRLAGARRPDRNLPLEIAAEVRERAEAVRTTTLVYLRSEVKSEIRRLREELPELDQELLVLRVDKGLEWRDLAAVLADDDLAPDELTREAARLRKRFQHLTARLRELARERGLLAGDD